MTMPTDTTDYAPLRRYMVEHQLRARGITDTRVLAAMLSVPREEFVPVNLRPRAYVDGALPIGYGQTISQPYTVAYMCEALQLRGDERVLEIGTGSGYGAAVLSELARMVFTVERIPELAAEARSRLKRLDYDNVHVFTGDGTLGLPDEAPFDAILVTAGGDELPEMYGQQVSDGGRIVIPLGHERGSQRMVRFTRRGSQLVSEDLGAFSFVPLVGQYGWIDTDRDPNE